MNIICALFIPSFIYACYMNKPDSLVVDKNKMLFVHESGEWLYILQFLLVLRLFAHVSFE